ncbi:MAG: response regulator transcription factor [Pseudonocardiales bacterium]|nr:response regulator transcription factor [Pseudonocardiales bacterium]
MIRTLIAERIALIRAGLVACISQACDIEVVAELDRCEPLLATVSPLQPDVAVIDHDIASHNEFAVINEMHEIIPSCRTLIMATRPHLRDLRKAVAAHATGFVVKYATPEDISQAIRQVASGMKAIDPDLAFAALDGPADPMTPREHDVLLLAANGASTAEIAGQLCLATGTVRNHISSIIIKTGARNRVDAIRMADHYGWL